MGIAGDSFPHFLHYKLGRGLVSFRNLKKYRECNVEEDGV